MPLIVTVNTTAECPRTDGDVLGAEDCPGHEDPDAPLCYVLHTFAILFTAWIL